MISERMDIDELQFVRLTPDFEFTEFDCGHDDLNDFLLNDAKEYQKGLIADVAELRFWQ